MGSQTNKVLKRKRRERWIKRKTTALKAAKVAKAAPSAAEPQPAPASA